MATSSAMEVISRIGTKVAAARLGSIISDYSIAKILKFEHLNLHMVMPALMREYLTTDSDSIALNAGAGRRRGLSIASVTVGATAVQVKELQSVSNADLSAPYQKCRSQEHYSSLSTYDEDGVAGRYWWPSRGRNQIKIYQGEGIAGTEENLLIGFVKEVDTSYAVFGADLDNITFDAPTESLAFLISSTAAKVFEDRRAQIPEALGAEVQDQKAAIQAVDAKMEAQLTANERLGADIRGT